MASADSLVYIESVDANSLGSETPLEHMRAAERVIAERGHLAESFACTSSGRIITPGGFSDTAFDLSVASQRSGAARGVEASQWGLPHGADYVSRHWMTAAATDPDNFARMEFPPWALEYISAPGDHWGSRATAACVYGNVQDIRLTPNGDTAITLQFCRDPHATSYCLFAHDLGSGQVRLLTRLRNPMEAQGDMSVSPDGRYLLAGHPMPNLIDIATGHCAGIGHSYRAAAWYPKAGASCILAVTGGQDKPPWKLKLIDLATFDIEDIADLPRRVDGLQVASDGTIAARMNTAGERGWFDELVVSTDDGRSFEPVSSQRGSSGWRRRQTKPRWIEAPPSSAGSLPGPGLVELYPGFEEFLRAEPPENGRLPREIDWILKTATYLIGHRATRLSEKPPTVGMLMDQLRILAALLASFNPSMAEEIIRQILPTIWSAASHVAVKAESVDAIEAIATGRQPPPFTFRFG